MQQKNDLFFRFFELNFTRMKKVSLPVSKSLYIRKLIYDFLYNGCIGAIPSDAPEDVRVVHHCLTCISQGAGGGVEQDESVLIEVRDCGAAYRFLMAVLAVTPGQWMLTGIPRLMQRPIEELVQALRSIGAEIQWCSCRDVPWRVSTNDMVIPNEDGAFSVSNVDGVISCRDAMHCVSTNNKVIPHGDVPWRVSTNTACNGFWQIRGKNLHASELTIDCTRSGQFASALLLISKKIGLQKLNVVPENPSSAAYIAMTKAIMDGKADLEADHMGDWSAAVYWYARLLLSQCHRKSKRNNDAVSEAASAFNADVFPRSYKLLNLDLDSIQSDAVIAQWFSQWGIISRQEEDGMVIELDEDADIQHDVIKSDEGSVGLEGHDREDTIVLDMSQNLDLVPVLACMACLWPKKMVFNGVANLKYKESDRLKIIQEELSEFAEIQLNAYNGIDDNQLVVNSICRDVPWRVSTDNAISCRDAMHCVSTNENCSNNAPIIFSFDAHNDHRFVMGFSLFALYGKVQVKGFDCVRKSYPNFNAEGVVAGTDIVG